MSENEKGTLANLEEAGFHELSTSTIALNSSIGDSLNLLIGSIIAIFMFVTWMAGIVLAQGGMKIVAIFPPYAYYLVVEKVMMYYGIIG